MKKALHIGYQSFVVRSVVLITVAAVAVSVIVVEIIVERYVGRGKSRA